MDRTRRCAIAGTRSRGSRSPPCSTRSPSDRRPSARNSALRSPAERFESGLLGGSDIRVVEVIAVGPCGSNFGPSAKERQRKQAKRWWVFVIAGSCQAVSAVLLIILRVQRASRDAHSALSVYL